MKSIIRPAASGQDAKEILRLIQELAIFENHTLDEVKITEEKIRKNGFGIHPYFQVLVAECDNKLVGYAFYYFFLCLAFSRYEKSFISRIYMSCLTTASVN